MTLLKDIAGVPDAELRPLLLLFFAKESFKIIEKKIYTLKYKGVIEKNSDIFSDIKSLIISYVDRFWAPIVIEEYVSFFNSSGMGYREFFLRKDLWQRKKGGIDDKYACELCFLKKLLQKEKYNFLLFLDRFFQDYQEICSVFTINAPLVSISGNLSDRHGQGSVLELSFSGGQKIIYKTRSAINDLFLSDYVKILDLDSVVHIPLAIDKKEYSWYEFVEYVECQKKKDLENFYRNAGSVLAVLDSLNYTDGHNENFICSSPYWYLIDSETILTNLSYFSDKINFFYDLEFTGMIQRLKRNEFSISAFQFNDQISYMPVSPFIENDCTENISLHYKTFRYIESIKSYPRCKKVDIKKYVPFIKDGMDMAYQKIANCRVGLIDLFNKYQKRLRLRQIHRHTIYYYWLLYKYYHPCNKMKDNFINDNLKTYSDNMIQYEKEMLINGDIPIFFHKPYQKHIYTSHKRLQNNFYQYTAAYWFNKKLYDIQNKEFRLKRLKEISELLSI